MTNPRGRAGGSAPRARLAVLTLVAATAACADQTPQTGTPKAVESLHAEATAVAPAPIPSSFLTRLPPDAAKKSCATPTSVPPQRAPAPAPDDDNPTARRRGSGPNDGGHVIAPPQAAPPQAAQPAAQPQAAQPQAATPTPAATDDSAERARKALEAQRTPVPRRGKVPEAAVPGAEACVRQLQMEFSLQTAAAGGTPADAAVQATLLKIGLRKPVVIRTPGGQNPAFAASTGSACIVGEFTGTKPTMEIAPLGPADTCTP